MARNRDRQFSESENLKFRLDQEYAQPEERIPHWAAQREESAEDRRSYWQEPGQNAFFPKDGPSSAYRPDMDDLLQDQPIQAPQTAEPSPRQGKRDESVRYADETAEDDPRDDIRAEADAAWAHQAQRVESTQPQYAQRNIGVEAGNEGEYDASLPPQPPRKQKNRRQNGEGKPKKKDDDQRSFLRTIIVAGVCILLFLMLALMVLANFVDHPLLALPRKWVANIVTPVQNAFSDVTDSVVGYLRTLKVRGNIEYEYEQALLRIDELETDLARMQELEYENEQLQDLLGEHKNHEQFNPIAATVIGNDGGNYFSTLTLNVGANDGVDEYMAVVSGGGLVGVTYEVEDNKCQVRCVINSDSTVAALVQSSRDQGSVKGTFGVNGEAMCRMYYLPDNSLPRPGDVVVTSGVGLEFPKGIPIGYIRESTRGMDENKSYVVLEPIVDFQHLEYVTVYRYKPAYAESAQVREDNLQLELQAIPTVRPVPTFSMGGVSDFLFSVTATPSATQPGQTPGPTLIPSPTPAVTATLDPNATQLPPNLEYIPNLPQDITPSPSPRPTPSPTPTVAPTQDPGGMTVEDEE